MYKWITGSPCNACALPLESLLLLRLYYYIPHNIRVSSLKTRIVCDFLHIFLGPTQSIPQWSIRKRIELITPRNSKFWTTNVPWFYQSADSHTLRPKMNEGKQKSQRNWISWQFKLTFCPFSGRVFEIVSLRPTEIWAPWYTNFGNPEIKNMDLWVLDDAYAVSKRNFDFQGCHLFSNIEFLLNYGNPELKITD